MADVLERILDAAVATGDPPAAQCCVIQAGAIVHESAHACERASLFDVASVTKVAATTSALASLVARGALDLDDPVRRFLPAFAHESVTVRSLLGHRSGLPAWRPFFARVMDDALAGAIYSAPTREAWARARAMVMEDVLTTPLEVPGRRVYSDIGFLMLGALLEECAGERLDLFCERELYVGRDMGFVDLSAERSWLDARHVLPTGRTRPREPVAGQRYHVPAQEPSVDPGRVDDDNAFAMGGVAGHAGLFATSRALAEFMRDVWLDDGLGLGATRDAFLAIDPATEGPTRALGFDVPTPGGTAGRLGEGARVFGHLGFTGASVWMDLDRELVAVLLSNRTLEGRVHVDGIRRLRIAVHDAFCDTLSGA